MRIVWYITGVLVAVALAVAAHRLLGPPRGVAPSYEDEDSSSHLVKKMLVLLMDDPRVRLQSTQRLVNAVAARTEAGTLDTPEGYYALGLRLHYGTGDVAGAEKAYRKAIALKPDWPWPYNSLGVLLYTSGKKKEAMKAFDKAMKLDPGWSRPHSDLAILYRVDGRLDMAEKEARTALKLDPDSAATNNNLGVLLDVRGHLKEAQQYYQRATQLDPTLPSPYYNLASSYARQKKKGPALDNLEKAVALDRVFLKELNDDPDFQILHGTPRFDRLIAQTQPPTTEPEANETEKTPQASDSPTEPPSK